MEARTSTRLNLRTIDRALSMLSPRVVEINAGSASTPNPFNRAINRAVLPLQSPARARQTASADCGAYPLRPSRRAKYRTWLCTSRSAIAESPMDEHQGRLGVEGRGQLVLGIVWIDRLIHEVFRQA
jgi:hypothetical protein